MSPNLVFGDYDANGKRDCAVKIAFDQQGAHRGAIIAFLYGQRDFVPHVIRSYVIHATSERDPSYHTYLQPHAKGTKGYDVKLREEFIFQNDAFMEAFDDTAAVSYIVEDNKFRRVITGD